MLTENLRVGARLHLARKGEGVESEKPLNHWCTGKSGNCKNDEAGPPTSFTELGITLEAAFEKYRNNSS